MLTVSTKALCAIAAVTLFAVAAQAQEDKFLFHDAVGVHVPEVPEHYYHKHVEALQDVPLKPVENLIDVLSYEVYLDIYNGLIPIAADAVTQMSYAATVDIKVVVLDGTLTGIPLHSDPFAVHVASATINGSAATFAWVSTKQVFTPPFAIHAGDTLALHIAYIVDRTPGGGLSIVNGREMTEAQGSYPMAFTFAEPENARRWFPCNDVPSDKAYFRARARLPISNRLVSNGELESVSLDGDTAKIETWSSADVMAPYLFVMNASKFNQYYQLYSRADGTGVPIRNFQWDTDEGGTFDAINAVRNVPAMFAAFEPKYGRYPFRSYGHCAIHPVSIGGMEHQTMTSVNRRWLEGNAEVGYAHELGHMWFGDAVTCATWGDIWLNEGGATFSEAIWREASEGPAGYRDQIMRRRGKYLEQGLDAPPVWNIPIGNLFNDPTTYAKASWIYHMMRRMLGDDVFFPALQTYLSQNRGKSLQTAHFETFWKEHIPSPQIEWEVFFNQWLVLRGHPIFWVRIETVPNDPTTYLIKVDQIQSHDLVPDVFQVPVEIQLFSDGVPVLLVHRVMNTRTLTFNVHSDQIINSFMFDPELKILHEVKNPTPTGTDDQPISAGTCTDCMTVRVIGSQPVQPGNEIVLGFENVLESAKLTLIDTRGETLLVESIAASQNVIRVNASRLSTGAYVAMLTSKQGTATVRFVVL